MTAKTNKQDLSTFYEFGSILGSFIIFLLYLIIVNLWVFDRPFWRYDDPLILSYVMTGNIGVELFSSESWQMLTSGFFFPLLLLSFAFDYKLAGLNPTFFYYHHIFVIYLISCATFIWLRSYIGKTRAFLAALLFLAGIPTFIIANQLMTRPYIEGLLFVILFLISCKNMELSFWYRLLGAFFLFLALMAKEVFIIFLLYPLFIQQNRPFIKRFSTMIPSIAGTILFLVWRTLMLKGIGGYGYTIGPLWNNIFGFLFSIRKVFFGEGWMSWCAAGNILFVFIFTILIYRRNSILRPVLKITCAACLMLSIFFPAVLTTSNLRMEYIACTYHRYLFVSWWSFSCMILSLPTIMESSSAVNTAVDIGKLKNGFIILFILATIALLSIQNQNSRLFNISKSNIENLYRYAVGSGAGYSLVYPDKYSWYIDLQLSSLAKVYMRPRLYVEYKENYYKKEERINYIIFDLSCNCFKGLHMRRIPGT